MPHHLSPSSLSLLKECPRCFWRHFNTGIKRPETIFPSLPSGMDRVLKAHFDAFRDKGELPPELQALNGEVRLFDDVKLLEVWRSNFKGIQWKDAKGNLFRGAVDNLLKKGEKLIVLDYKTRGFPLKEDTHTHYQDQMDIYNLLLRKNGHATEDYAYLLFYHPTGVHADGRVDFKADLVKLDISIRNAEEIFSRAIEILGKDMPEPSAECGFCAWALSWNKTK